MAIPDNNYETLDLSLHIFYGNHLDLVDVLHHVQLPEVFLPAWNDGLALDGLQREVCRFLHNWLASSLSLVNHSRRVTRDKRLLSEQVFNEFSNRLDLEFRKDPLHGFVQGLRNYALHYDIPFTFPQMGGSLEDGVAGEDWKQGLCIDLVGLKQWDGWNEQALEFLRGSGESVYLLDLVEAYGGRIHDLYEWLLKRNRQDRMTRFAPQLPSA